MNAYGLALAIDHQGCGVAYVCMPQRAGTLGLPTEPHLAARGVSAAKRYAVQAVLLIEASYAARRDGVLVESPLGDECAQNHRHRGGRMLLADGGQQLPLLGSQVAAAATIGTGRWAQR